MNSNNGDLYFAPRLQLEQMQNDINKLKSMMSGMSKNAVKESNQINKALTQVAKIGGDYLSFQGVNELVSQIANVRGEFQQLEIAFSTMLGSKAKANKLMAEVVDTAAKTPFNLQDVADGAKQLLAYGSESHKVTNELKMLGNIASGLSIPLNDMVYLYGTTRTQGQLYTQDLKQFMECGIPIAEELAKQFGVTKDKVSELVKACKVGFPEVQKALQNMTSSGGQFYNLMEEQSKTITGKMSNISDSFSQMLNNIGKSNENAINSALDRVGYLVENYEEIGKKIAELKAIHGTYKAVIITLNALEKARSRYMLIYNKNLAYQTKLAMMSSNVSRAKARAMARETMSHRKLTGALIKQQLAQLKANATAMLNPYVLIATAVVGAGYAIYKFATALNSAELATKGFNATLEKQKKQIESEKSQLNDLIGTIKDDVSTRTEKQMALEKLQKLYPTIFSNMDVEAVQQAKINELLGLGNQELEKRANLSTQQKIEEIDKTIASKPLQKYQQANGSNLDDLNQKIETQEYEAYKAKIKKLGKEFNIPKTAWNSFDDLEQAVIQISEKLKQQQSAIEQARRRADFNALDDAEKKKIKEQELILEKQRLAEIQSKIDDESKKAKETGGYSATLNFYKSQRKIQLKTIEDIEISIAGYDKSKEKLRNVKQVLKEIAEQEKIKAELQKKAQGGGISAKEDKDLKDTESKISELNKEYERYTNKNKTDNKSDDYKKQIETNIKERTRLQIDLDFQARQAEINAKDEGLKKKLAQNQLDYDIELEQLRRQGEDKLQKINDWKRTEWKAKNPNKKGDFKEQTELSGTDKEQFKEIETNIKIKFESSTEMLYSEELNKQAEFVRAYLDKAQELEDKKAELKKNGHSDEVINKVTEIDQEQLNSLDEQMQIREETINKLVSDLVGMGIEEVLIRLEEAQEVLKAEMQGENKDKNRLKQLQAKVKTLQIALKQKTQAQATPPDTNKWQSTVDILMKVNDTAQKAISGFDGLSDTVKDTFSLLFTVSQGAVQVVSTIQAVAQGAAAGIKLTSASAVEGVKSVERASVVLAIISVALQIAQQIAQMVASSKQKEHAEKMRQLDDKTKALKRSYQSLGKAIEKAYGTDASKLIQQQDEILRKQKRVLQSKIQEEGKRKDKKQDKNSIAQWKGEIKAIDDQLGATKDKMKDAIIGEDVKSAIDEFANAYMNAWGKGEDKAKAMKDVAKDMVKSAIKQFLSSKMSGAVEKYYNYLAQAMTNGYLDEYEKATLKQLEADILNSAENMNSQLKELYDSEDERREADKKGFATASQDSVDDLNGTMTLSVELDRQILDITKHISADLTLLQETSSLQLQRLTNIDLNTSKLYDIDISVDKLGRTLDEIQINGLKVK